MISVKIETFPRTLLKLDKPKDDEGDGINCDHWRTFDEEKISQTFS